VLTIIVEVASSMRRHIAGIERRPAADRQDGLSDRIISGFTSQHDDQLYISKRDRSR